MSDPLEHRRTNSTLVLRDVLERHAEERPGQTFAVLSNGQTLTYDQTLLRVRSIAAALQKLGVEQGDHVLCWMGADIETVLIWFALNYIGAVYMPLNTAYRGLILEHAVSLSDARLILAHTDLVTRLCDVDRGSLQAVVVLGSGEDRPALVADLKTYGAAALSGAARELRAPARPIEPWDTQSIILTSGTTGPSKAVLSSYAHLYALCGPEGWPFIEPNDRFLLTLPLFHVGGLSAVYAMLVRGASFALVDSFQTKTFWAAAKATQSTVAGLMGAMTPFLLAEPVSPIDRDHGLRMAIVMPLPGNIPAFRARFGIDVYTVFGMTEVSTPLISDRNPAAAGLCGRPRAGIAVRLVDEHDIEVIPGQVGELILRSDAPWTMNHGYYKNPEATAQAWRNGWFHTGDCFRQDAKGNYFFVDRKKDAIRRRGENISSFEVEAAVSSFPTVKEVAAVGVPSEFSEEELLIVVAAVDGQAISPQDLVQYLSQKLPYFMVPRYIRVVEALPKTPTQKVEKHVLRSQGVTPDTFDRESAGLRLKQERLVSRTPPAGAGGRG
ncbi:crotonobetaine/carnitine-CoA ligase [Rhizobiales bacterium GAS191]|nr:crotonobetaine/carnitine-CoA ligase [Rhizobiales bacterium GAS191]